MYFERKSYLQQLISAEGNGMIKGITDIRRCGKSFLLFDIFKKHLLSRNVQEDHILQMKLRHVSDKFKKIVIVGDRYHSAYNEEGIQLAGIYDFLLHQ